MAEFGGIDIYNFMSLSSASAAYFKQQGCFEGVMQVSGSLNHHLHQFISGGVCMIAENQKHIIDTPLELLDFCALYTFVQSIIPYPKGEPNTMS